MPRGVGRSWRDTENLGRLLAREPREVAELHQFGRFRIDHREMSESFVQHTRSSEMSDRDPSWSSSSSPGLPALHGPLSAGVSTRMRRMASAAAAKKLPCRPSPSAGLHRSVGGRLHGREGGGLEGLAPGLPTRVSARPAGEARHRRGAGAARLPGSHPARWPRGCASHLRFHRGLVHDPGSRPTLAPNAWQPGSGRESVFLQINRHTCETIDRLSGGALRRLRLPPGKAQRQDQTNGTSRGLVNLIRGFLDPHRAGPTHQRTSEDAGNAPSGPKGAGKPTPTRPDFPARQAP